MWIALWLLLGLLFCYALVIASARVFGKKDRSYRLRLGRNVDIYTEQDTGFAFYYMCEFNDDDSGVLIIKFFYGCIYISFGRLKNRSDNFKYGFYTYENDSFWLWYGNRSKVIYWPWSWDFHSSNYIMSDGCLVNKRMLDDFIEQVKIKPLLDEFRIQVKTYPYTYICDNGNIQERMVTVHMTRYEWWWRLKKLVGIGKTMVRKSIEVEFDKETGSRAGSFKGGVVACSYTMLPDETMDQCIRRMEKERRF